MSITNFIFAILTFSIITAAGALLGAVIVNSFPNLTFKSIGKSVKKYFKNLLPVTLLARTLQLLFLVLIVFLFWYSRLSPDASIESWHLVKPYLEKSLIAIFLIELLARGSHSFVEDLVNKLLKK